MKFFHASLKHEAVIMHYSNKAFITWLKFKFNVPQN